MSDMIQLPTTNDIWRAPEMAIVTDEETGEQRHELVRRAKDTVDSKNMPPAPGQMTPDQAAFFYAQVQHKAQAPK